MTRVSIINVGLESFAESLRRRMLRWSRWIWQPPAGRNEKLMAILERMQG